VDLCNSLVVWYYILKKFEVAAIQNVMHLCARLRVVFTYNFLSSKSQAGFARLLRAHILESSVLVDRVPMQTSQIVSATCMLHQGADT
jgi:hypothetical protein